MNDPSDESWFGVRSVVQWRQKADGKNVFEERIVVFCAHTPAEALVKAQGESDRYTEEGPEPVDMEFVAYHQDGGPLIDGYEVWSERYETDEDYEAFYAARYEKYKYHPDP